MVVLFGASRVHCSGATLRAHCIRLDMMRPYSEIFLCGDFKAHHVSWDCSRSTSRGSAINESSLDYDLISINDTSPTYVPGSGSSPSNIDLIFCPLAPSYIAKVDVIADPFGSDHLPVVLELETAVSAASRPTCRINTEDVSWARFHGHLEADLPRLRGSLESAIPLATVYDEFVRTVLEHLLSCGAVRRDDSARGRRTQPLW